MWARYIRNNGLFHGLRKVFSFLLLGFLYRHKIMPQWLAGYISRRGILRTAFHTRRQISEIMKLFDSVNIHYIYDTIHYVVAPKTGP